MDKLKSENTFNTTDDYKQYLFSLAFPKMTLCIDRILASARKSSDVYMACYGFKRMLMEILYFNDFADNLAFLLDNKLKDPGSQSYYRFKNDYFDPDYDFEVLLCYINELSSCLIENLEYVYNELTHDKDLCKHVSEILKVFVLDKVKKEKPLEDYSIYEYIEQCFIKIFISDLAVFEENVTCETLD